MHRITHSAWCNAWLFLNSYRSHGLGTESVVRPITRTSVLNMTSEASLL
jgi:hypothetical protein